MVRGGLRLSNLIVLAISLLGCGDDDVVVIRSMDAGDQTHEQDSHDGGVDSSVSVPIRVHSTHDAGSAYEEDGGSTAATCGEVNCGLHGDCVESDKGDASCVCDHGYVANGTAQDGICVEDKTCIDARLLECRFQHGGSAVALHVSLQYCSGNPYTSLDVKDLTVEEKGNEDFQELLPNESSATIIPHDFVAQIYVVVDVSNSIRDSNVLDDVGKGLQTLLDQLEKAGGDYRFSVFLFDGSADLYEFIKDTDDLAAARKTLGMLNSQTGADPSSSNVYGAVIEGIRKLDRARSLRQIVNDYGILTTGTLIVVSDGDDRASLRTFKDVQDTVNNTVESVITVGLGDVANYPKLTQIGRDGSFSAQQPELIGAAFEQIAQRINDYGKSQYLVGYCSPKRTGQFAARVGVRGLDFERPQCTFSADSFVAGCNAAVFDPAKYCAGSQCGGVIGCGECQAGSCCAAGQCQAPTTLNVDDTCGQEWLCPDGTTCSSETCKATVVAGSSCDAATNLCDLGVTYCAAPPPLMPGDPPAAPMCMTSKALSDPCKEQKECQSGHCGAPPEDPLALDKVCLFGHEMYQGCSDDGACERGAYCEGKTLCKAQNPAPCSTNAQCATGKCDTLASGAKLCAASAQCYFPLEL